MTTVKNSMTKDGKVYHSVPHVARLLGTTTTKLKQIALAEGMEFVNFRANGKLWISARSVADYLDRFAKKST